MRFTPIPSSAAALAVGAVLAAPDEAPVPPEDGAAPLPLEAFRWSGDLPREATLVARNDYGELHVQESSDGQLLVSAMIQKIGGAADELVVGGRPPEGRGGAGGRRAAAGVAG